MGCACGKNRRTATARAAGTTYAYEFTPPDGGDTITYMTPLEAKGAVRRHAGGNVRRVTVTAAS